MKINLFISVCAMFLLAGCFVCSETEFPEVKVTRLPQGKDLQIQLTGFESVVTTYVPVYGYETVFTSRPMSRHRRRPYFYSATYATETYVPQSATTTVFAERAAEMFEKGGCILHGSNPVYRVDVKFGGPYSSDSDGLVSAMWSIFSVFTAGYGYQTWSAKLKVYEIATGKLVFHKDYTQRYEAVVWGPIPIFSPAGSETISYGSMQNWCLSALTDAASADALSFLSSSR